MVANYGEAAAGLQRSARDAQSFRRARVGSTDSARRAGSTHAASAIATSSTETPANVTGSVGVTPHN